MSKAENDKAFEEWRDRIAPIFAAPSAETAWRAACAYMAERAATIADLDRNALSSKSREPYAIKFAGMAAGQRIANEIRKLVEE